MPCKCGSCSTSDSVTYISLHLGFDKKKVSGRTELRRTGDGNPAAGGGRFTGLTKALLKRRGSEATFQGFVERDRDMEVLFRGRFA